MCQNMPKRIVNYNHFQKSRVRLLSLFFLAQKKKTNRSANIREAQKNELAPLSIRWLHTMY